MDAGGPRDVRDVLPQREPFLLLDAVVEVDVAAGRLRARRRFRPDEPWFAGHFPGDPIVPGVLLVEAMAQLLAYFARTVRPGAVVFLTGIDRARFRGVVRPGDEVEIDLAVEGETMGVWRAKATARVGGRRVCDAQVSGAMRA